LAWLGVNHFTSYLIVMTIFLPAALVGLLSVVAYFAQYILPCRVFHVPTGEGIILITGCSSGIGRDAAIALAKQYPSFTIYGTVRKDKDAKELQDLNIKNLKPLMMDVTKPDQIAEAVKTIQATKIPLIGLVNNAGISTRGPLEAVPLKDVRSVYEVNVFGVHMVTQAFLPLLRASQGRIVNIGSVAGLIASPGSSIYSGTKFALEGISDALRRELLPFNISVSIVEPAFVKTKIMYKELGQVVEDVEVLGPPEMQELYADYYSLVYKRREKNFKHASTTDVTSSAIIHALTNPYPHARYVVANVNGVPAWLLRNVMWALSDPVKDILVTGQDKALKVMNPNAKRR